MRPIRLPLSSVNHRLPSGPGAMSSGPLAGLIPVVNWVMVPLGVNPGRVAADLAVMLAGGGEAIADLALLRDQSGGVRPGCLRPHRLAPAGRHRPGNAGRHGADDSRGDRGATQGEM
jgi:hypothetical protein